MTVCALTALAKDTKIMTDTQTDTRLLNSFSKISPKEEQPYL